MKNVQQKVNCLASQEYLETKFKQMITEDLLNLKLKELENVIKLEVQREIDNVSKEVKAVTDRIMSIESTIKKLRNKVSDLEVKAGNFEEEKGRLTQKNRYVEEKVDERDVWIKALKTITSNNTRFAKVSEFTAWKTRIRKLTQ